MPLFHNIARAVRAAIGALASNLVEYGPASADRYILHVKDTQGSLSTYADYEGISGVWCEVVYNEAGSAQVPGASVYGLGGAITVEDGSKSPYGMYPLYFAATHSSAGDTEQMHGIFVNLSHYGAGDIAELAGFVANLYVDAAAGATTTAYGVRVTRDGTGAIGTAYGIHIPNMKTNVTTGWAIYTNGGGHRLGDFIEMPEQTAPAAPSANNGRLFFRDNGSGKTQFCVIYPSGAIEVVSTEP